MATAECQTPSPSFTLEGLRIRYVLAVNAGEAHSMMELHNAVASQCGRLESGYTVLATDQCGQPQWHQFPDARAALRGWGDLLWARCAKDSPDCAERLHREELRLILEGAAAGELGLHDVAGVLNAVAAPMGLVLWAGPLTVRHKFSTAFAA